MLFVVLLGGKHPRAKIEVHDVVFVVADDLAAAHGDLKAQWFGDPHGVHIDAWMRVEGVDGWRVSFGHQAPAAGAPRLFFLNLGGYLPGDFGESHQYLLVVARDRAAARALGRQRYAATRWHQPHTDALLDVDDCVPIDQVGGRYVQLTPGGHAPIERRSDYTVL
ncbi:DUF1543 domain-containing protein [Xylophilus sp.]|uniref:DUF1543 domain-containing protein n=1 Tax=Xylophilus sp. TaxID=2653893 RepID=UPI0013BC55D5|nr:DUF1543 domain-containing protein [Xylophilus sp.]KAF1046311.1 MAG: hypothetical protein GAK38_02551 [Xylophilus sp.]